MAFIDPVSKNLNNNNTQIISRQKSEVPLVSSLDREWSGLK